MTGVNMPNREYTNTAQLVVVAPDPATGGAVLDEAVAAMEQALASFPNVTLLTEKSDGLFVFSQQ